VDSESETGDNAGDHDVFYQYKENQLALIASLDLVEVASEIEPTVIGAFETNAEPAIAPT
jgi:hypothetical protein